MGPYYITAMASLVGRISCLTATSKKTFDQRLVASERHFGKIMDVEVDTHVKSFLEFDTGASGTLITSFDIKGGSHLPSLQIFGTEGSIAANDPNNFGPNPHNPGGSVQVKLTNSEEWKDIPLTHGYSFQNRGIGISDMADAIVNNRPHRASGELTFHTMEVMEGILIAAKTRKEYTVQSPCQRPEPLAPLRAETVWPPQVENKKAA
jgi:predicted dehydrogenase